ncbi:MAG: ABC transporter [Proteobacteria bacterium]|nr:ABC transporter [Pseudomonadota bacterium]
MKINKKVRSQFRIQNSIFVALLIGLALLLGYLSDHIDLQWDLTSNQRHSLSKASKDFIAGMEGPVRITAYVSKSDVEGSIRPVIHTFLEPYRRAKPDISIFYVDPREEPQKAEEAGVRFDGELVIQYKGRQENLSTLTEQELTNLLTRLARASDKIIYELEGHSERSMEGTSPRDMGLFGQQLMKTGFKLSKVNLAKELSVNKKASVLIIASPKVNLLPGELNRVKRFLEEGGNLLWVMENDSYGGMESLADYLGAKLVKGIALDPRAGSLNLSPAFALVSRYFDHPATKGSSMTSVFPFARAVEEGDDKGFKFSPLVEVADQGWLEMGSLSDASFDPEKDRRGPIVVAGAFERSVAEKNQRVVIVGSGHILSNQHLGLLGNLDFGVNIINWLTGDESFINIQPRSRNDQSLEINLPVFILANSFLFLPILFLVIGGIVWWRRRRA